MQQGTKYWQGLNMGQDAVSKCQRGRGEPMSGCQQVAECNAAEESCYRWMQPNPEGVQEPPAGGISTSNWDCTATSMKACPSDILACEVNMQASRASETECWPKVSSLAKTWSHTAMKA